MRFGEKLSFLRKQCGMTQIELAEKLDISRQAVSRWEQGTAEPSTENLIRIGKLFGVPVDDLVNGTIQQQVEPPMLVNEVRDKKEPKKHYIYCIAMIVGIVLIAIVAVIIAYSGFRRDYNPSPLEDMNRDIVVSSDTVALPLG